MGQGQQEVGRNHIGVHIEADTGVDTQQADIEVDTSQADIGAEVVVDKSQSADFVDLTAQGC